MTNELEVADVRVPTIVDEPMDFTVVARDPEQMIRAQRSLTLWAARKIQSEKDLLRESQEQLDIATKSKWSTTAWRKRVKLSEAKIEFYKKIKSALEAGYYIVPPFPLDIFAVRTSRSTPKWENSNDKHIAAVAQTLPEGEGRYVARALEVGENHRYGNKPDGTTDFRNIVSTWYNSRDFQSVDFPFKLAKPEIMAETAKAFALKIFDQFGVLPKAPTAAVAVRNDPIVCGQILAPHKNKAPVTFFVAWWLDTKSL